MGLGRLLIVLGVMLVVAGVAVSIGSRYFTGVPRLPGDIVVRRSNFTFYFPLATSIIVSVLLTLVMWLFSRR